MKKLIFLITIIFAFFCNANAFCRRGTQIHAETEQASITQTTCSVKHSHWQRVKHAISCPCGSICAIAIRALEEGNLSLLKTHISPTRQLLNGKSLFDYMIERASPDKYRVIYQLLIENGFNPLYEYEENSSALYRIIELKNIVLFRITTSYFIDQINFNALCTMLYNWVNIHQPESFYSQAFSDLASKSPLSASAAMSRRRLTRTQHRYTANQTMTESSDADQETARSAWE